MRWRYRVVEIGGCRVGTIELGAEIVDDVAVAPNKGDTRRYDLLDATTGGTLAGFIAVEAVEEWAG